MTPQSTQGSPAETEQAERAFSGWLIAVGLGQSAYVPDGFHEAFLSGWEARAGDDAARLDVAYDLWIGVCDRGHVALKSSDAAAFCSHCGQTVLYPAEDKCPECAAEGCMGLACPECGEEQHETILRVPATAFAARLASSESKG